ncbi:MAG TPA: DUF6249 domain-containing protein [Hyphomonadaceae bacterium]|nr:DUF6249 domain-containing protein [Hyphomonadaceae bacterium]HPN05887.1 DUF6249 domain-containing protein [Hyphomonadaceae bacterium]
MDASIFIPISFFGMIILIVWLTQYFGQKKRAEAMKTLRLAIEKGQPLTPETLASMARVSSPIADLRRGIIFVAIAAGFGSFATIVGTGIPGSDGPEVMRGLLGVATFPLFIGLAFLGLHFFANESKRG